MSDLTKPLSEVSVGAHVVHDGEVWQVSYKVRPGANRFIHRPGAPLTSRWLPHHTRVLHLDGDAPRPLAECDRGRAFFDPDPEHCLDPLFVVDALGHDGNWEVSKPGSGGDYLADPDWPVWPIVAPQPAADQPQRWEVERADSRWSVTDGPNGPVLIYDAIDEPTARALADHLNATGWQPPAPEPERPTADDCIKDWSRSAQAGETCLEPVEWLSDHGYSAPVDVQALGDAIAWLKLWVGPPSSRRHARALLDALGVDR